MKSEIPNITGSFASSKDNCYRTPERGAFSGVGHPYERPSQGPTYYSTGFAVFYFDASGSNNRYGNYTEVNPLYSSCKFIIQY